MHGGACRGALGMFHHMLWLPKVSRAEDRMEQMTPHVKLSKKGSYGYENQAKISTFYKSFSQSNNSFAIVC